MLARGRALAVAAKAREAARAAEVIAEAPAADGAGDVAQAAELSAALNPPSTAYVRLSTSTLVNPYIRLSDIAVLLSIASYCGRADQDGARWCWPTIGQITARAPGMQSRRAVQTAVSRLARFGLITRYPRGSRYRSNYYRVDA